MTAPSSGERFSPALDDWLRRVDGLFVGQLSEDEMHDLREAIKRGMAREVYEGGAGFMGLARIRRTP